MTVPLGASFTTTFQPNHLGGVDALMATITTDASDRTVVAIPYFAWANRGRGEMVVWVRQ